MRKVCCFLFSSLLVLAVRAQSSHFIYFQTENNTPFYIKMGERVMSATASGYLILPDLPDSTYNIAIGFPSVLVESRFRIPIGGNDLGFLIRNAGNSPSLSDLQNGASINPFVDEADRNVTYQERTDAFTTLLSAAANDPTLVFVAVRPAPVVRKESPPPPAETVKTTVTPPPSNDTATAVTAITTVDTTGTASINPPKDTTIIDTSVKTAGRPVTATITTTDSSDTATVSMVIPGATPPEPAYQRSVVKRHSESSTGEGFGLVYYDNTKDGIDTIRLLIPNPRIVLKPKDTTVYDGQMLNLKDIPAYRKDTLSTPPPSYAATKVCKAMASESDFFKLRKAMAARVSDEAMVEEAKKSFRARCFTTEQVRNLGSLFLTSAGKYQFFDAAYEHVSDTDQFSTLASELKDDYYLKRFKALIGY